MQQFKFRSTVNPTSATLFLHNIQTYFVADFSLYMQPAILIHSTLILHHHIHQLLQCVGGIIFTIRINMRKSDGVYSCILSVTMTSHSGRHLQKQSAWNGGILMPKVQTSTVNSSISFYGPTVWNS